MKQNNLKMVLNFKDLIKEKNEKEWAISTISGVVFMNLLRFIFLLVTVIFFISCNQNETEKSIKQQENKLNINRKQFTVIIQPFADLPLADLEYVTKELKKNFKTIVIKSPIEFPRRSLNQSRTRHRADSLIQFLSDRTKDGYLTIGLTSRDISASKDNHADWGIMGLGYCPGKSCIASSFRLSGTNKREKLFKVAIHELGHTQGLPHCPVNTCFMRDAVGKDHINEEKEFCPKCKAVLIKAA